MKIHAGFTLTEVMITLAVGVIVLAVGVPALNNMLSTNRAAGYANSLVGAIRLARSEAVKRGDSVTICASNVNQTACSANDWNNGWIVFFDDNEDGTYNAGETIRRVWSIPPGERAGLVFEPTSPNSIRFISNGANSLDAQISFTFKKSDCMNPAVQARQISISRLGRASLDIVACF